MSRHAPKQQLASRDFNENQSMSRCRQIRTLFTLLLAVMLGVQSVGGGQRCSQGLWNASSREAGQRLSGSTCCHQASNHRCCARLLECDCCSAQNATSHCVCSADQSVPAMPIEATHEDVLRLVLFQANDTRSFGASKLNVRHNRACTPECQFAFKAGLNVLLCIWRT